ncbi:MAG: carbohydrate kinase [Alistipes sp.]|nr:carbohydrate kinase [Alistipes sp.]
MKNLIIGVGEALWDCFCDMNDVISAEKLGGAPANFVFHATQLNMNAVVVSAVGNDEKGRKLINELEARGIKLLIKVQNDYPTGMVKARSMANGDVEYDIIAKVAYDHIPFTPELETLVPEIGAVCFGTLAQRENGESAATIRRLLGMLDDDVLKVYDINMRPTCDVGEADDIFRANLELANVLKINEPELHKLAGLYGVSELSDEDICKFFIEECNLKMLIHTLGEKGSIVYYKEGQQILKNHCCNRIDELLSQLGIAKDANSDFVGAGDSFTAAFISALLKGRSVTEAHQLASTLATYVCTKQGAMPSMDKRVLF